MNRDLTVRGVVPIRLPAPPRPTIDSDSLSAAVIDEMAERGYERTTLEGVLRRAKVSRQDFDRRFDSLDACALDVYERMVTHFQREVGEAFNRHEEWPDALRAAAYACADWIVKRPNAATFGAAEILKMRNELAQVRREEILAFCAELIDRGREIAPDPDSIPETAPIFAIGAAAHLLTRRVQEREAFHPHEMVPEMMNRIVLIYLGADAAEAEWTASRL